MSHIICVYYYFSYRDFLKSRFFIRHSKAEGPGENFIFRNGNIFDQNFSPFLDILRRFDSENRLVPFFGFYIPSKIKSVNENKY